MQTSPSPAAHDPAAPAAIDPPAATETSAASHVVGTVSSEPEPTPSARPASETILASPSENPPPSASAPEDMLNAAAEQIARQAGLPAALREELAALVAHQGQPAAHGVQLPVEALLPLLARTLPSFLRRDPDHLETAEHPGGDAFFDELEGELSEARAERLARQQLAASGLLRGQTVRRETSSASH